MVNIHRRQCDSISNTYRATHDTNSKMPIFDTCRAITVNILGSPANKTPGAQHIMSNIHRKLCESNSNTSGATRNTKVSDVIMDARARVNLSASHYVSGKG